MIWLLLSLAILLAATFAVMLLEPNLTNLEPNTEYKQDIDWSLLAKGYPVVNDEDIQYTEWLAQNPEKV